MMMYPSALLAILLAIESIQTYSIMPIQREGMEPPPNAYDKWDAVDHGTNNNTEVDTSVKENTENEKKDGSETITNRNNNSDSDLIEKCKDLYVSGKLVLSQDVNGNTPDGATSTRTPTPSAIKFSCNFEENMCGIKEDTISDNFDWLRTSNSTSSTETGPDQAYSGEYYIYTEASGRQHDEKARILVPSLPGPYGKSCLTFKFHMSGHHTGALKAFIWRTDADLLNDDIGRWVIFNQEGEKGNGWMYAEVSLYLEPEDRIAFEGIIGTGHTSDIALDDIMITSQHCHHGSIITHTQN